MIQTGEVFLADTHVHSRFSHDSEARISDICKAAREKHIGAVCITDHADIKPHTDMEEQLRIRKDVALTVAKEKENPDGVELLLGIELACGGFYPQNDIFDRVADTLLTVGSLDCVIGSVHSVGAISTARNNYAQMNKGELLGCMDRYFDAVLAMLEYGQPDVLAHLTYPLRYINGKFERGLNWQDLEPKIKQILSWIIDKHIALEINTSCLGTYYDALMPDKDILRLYRQMGGTLLTLGSDAHKPENLAKGFQQTVAWLKTQNVTQLQYVKNRQFHPYQI